MTSPVLQIKLSRICEIEDGTFGVVSINSIPKFITVEPNWRNNGKNSCIPIGVFSCSKYSSPKYPDTLEVHVTGRDNILFHAGNIEDHSLGCIILGKSFGSLKGKVSVTDSVKSFSEFKAIIKSYEFFRLTVVSQIAGR